MEFQILFYENNDEITSDFVEAIVQFEMLLLKKLLESNENPKMFVFSLFSFRIALVKQFQINAPAGLGHSVLNVPFNRDRMSFQRELINNLSIYFSSIWNPAG